MRKHNLLRYCLLLIAAASGLVASAADAGMIYLVDWGKISGGAPLVENENRFTRLNETEAGSRIYVGNHEFVSTRNYFRFYSSLQEGPEVNWKLDNICPLTESVMPERGKSGIFFTTNVHDTHVLSPLDEPGAWELDKRGTYKVTVDLNAGTLELLPVNDYLVMFNDASRPESGAYDQYPALSTLNTYMGAGDIRMYFYSPYNRAWLDTKDIVILPFPYLYASIEEISVSETASPLELKNWPGGVLYSSYDGGLINFNTDKYWVTTSYSADIIYLVGTYSGWTFDGLTWTPVDDDKTIFNIELPVNLKDFKFTAGPSWDINFGCGDIVKDEAGQYVATLVPGGPNFYLDMASDRVASCILNLKEMTLTFPSWVDLHTTPDIDYSEVLFVATANDNFEMWDEAPSTIANQFDYLRKTVENEWQGEIYISNDNNRFHLISSLTAKGQPNMVIAPASGSDVALEYIDGYAYASATVKPDTEASYWVFNKLGSGHSNIGHKVTLTVTRSADKYTLKVDDKQSVNGGNIYIIGQPNGWDIQDDSMPLQLTDRGGYYGCYTLPEGDNYFRFYTELGNWGSDGKLPSIGAEPFDGINYDVQFSGYYSGSCTPGKGCWILHSTGEPIYFYVDLNSWRVIFSSNPIPEAGNVIDAEDRNQVKDGLFMSMDGGDKVELESKAEGVYTYRPDYIMAGTHTFSFFTRLLPIPSVEPEWAGSYTVGLKGDGVADFTEANHAVFDLEVTDAVGTTPATPLTLILDDDVMIHYGEITVDLNTKKLYVADFERGVIVYNGEELPSAVNAASYTDRLLGEHGGIVNIPTGKFDIRFYHPGYPLTEGMTEHISFADDPFAYADNGTMYGWSNSRLVADDWHGGPLFINPSMAYDLSRLTTVSAMTWNGVESVAHTMTETAPGSLIYKGIISLVPGGNDTGYTSTQSFYFKLAEKDAVISYPYGDVDSHMEIILGSPYVMNSVGMGGDAQKGNLKFSNDVAESAVAVRGNSFMLTNIPGAAKLEVTLDLNTMKMSATVTEGNVATGFETVGNASSPLDGAMSYTNTFTPATSYIDAPDVPARAGGYDFNLVTDRSTAIVPASGANTVIAFDAAGCWQGSYREVPAPAAANAPESMRRAVLRNQASQLAQWHLDVPDGDVTDLAVAIDESSKTITIHSLAHNKGFFIATNLPGTKYPRVDNLAEIPMLNPAEAEGVFVGHIELTEATPELSNILFLAQPITAHGNRSGGYKGIINDDNWNLNLTAGDPAVVNAWHLYTREGNTLRTPVGSFILTAPAGKYEIIYDSRDNTLSMSTNITGIDSVTADGVAATGVTIIPGKGCVTVTATEATRVDFYAVSGVTVKSVEVPAGTTTVTIAPGFYITAGQKIVVR